MDLSMMTMIYLGSLYAGWVLLPLIPAVLIYWLFPSTTVAVDGPFANLTVKASGAFAAYLIIFAATYSLMQTTKDTIGGFQRSFWTITAQIKLLNTDGLEIRADDLIKKLRVRPPPLAVDSYLATLKVFESEGQLPFRITMEIPDFGEEAVDLKTQIGATTNLFRKTIEFKEPIQIRKSPDMGSNRPTPVLQLDRAQASTETR
jgi:hypothetical protein